MNNSSPSSQPAQPTIEEVVILVHGIRDFGAWQPQVERALTSDIRVVIPLRYGYFDVFRFLSPIPMHSGKVRWLERKIDHVVHQYPGANISVIAHSFGTFLLSKVLQKAKFQKFHRVVLCGGIIPRSFDWMDVTNAFSHTPTREYIINECGNADIWPVLAEAASHRYSRTGVDGFGDPGITDRFHEGAHSNFLNEAFAYRYWLPFFERGERVDSRVEPGSGVPHWLSHLVTPQFTWLTRFLLWLTYLAVLGLTCLLLFKLVDLTPWPISESGSQDDAISEIQHKCGDAAVFFHSDNNKAIKSLDLSACVLDHYDLKNWFRDMDVSNLNYLNLSGTPIETLEPLSQLKMLKRLNLSNCPDLDPEDLGVVKNMDLLEKLLLSGSADGRRQIVNGGLQYLKGLSRLNELALKFTDAGSGLADIGELKSLKKLDLTGTMVRAADLAALSHFPELTELQLGNAKIGNAGVAELRRLKQLQILDLTSTGITNEGLGLLTEMTSLKRLTLDKNGLSSRDIEELREEFKRNGCSTRIFAD